MHVAFSSVRFRLDWRSAARVELDRLIARLLAIVEEMAAGAQGAAGRPSPPGARCRARERGNPFGTVEARGAPLALPDDEGASPARAAGASAGVPGAPAPAAERRAEYERLVVEVRAQFTRLSGGAVGTTRDGIRVVDARTLETERYRIEFENGHTLRVTDLRSNQYTRVWGDPHVDVSTVKGVMDGEFSDLTASEDVTTFLLKDGTRIRFQAPDRGLIERVDVTRGGARVSGVGMEQGIEVGRFHEVGSACDVSSEAGDVVSAGDDGASWYDQRGRLVWGAGPEVSYISSLTSRSASSGATPVGRRESAPPSASTGSS
jgi:hypothetical protein